MRSLILMPLFAAALLPLAPAMAQNDDDNVPPVITNITWRIAYNDTGVPFSGIGNIDGLPLFDPATDKARELDVLFAFVTISDPDFPGGSDAVFVQQTSFWIAVPGYPTPEPPPITTDTIGFIPTDGEGFKPADPNATEFDLVFSIPIPPFEGKNQARLRAIEVLGEVVDYDVEWFIQFAVTNEQSGEDVVADVDGDFIQALENPVLAPPNPPPFADAGADVTIEAGTTYQLDPSRTFDGFNVGFSSESPNVFEKDELVYTWEWISGPERVEPVYRDPEDRPEVAEVTLNEIGAYVYRLTVDDRINPLPTTDSVTITVVSLIPENHAPRAAIIGPTDAVLVGSVVRLDGTTSSDPDGDPLTYRWRQTDELGNNLSPEDAADIFQPLGGVDRPISTWQAVQPGTFYFRLLVSDGELSSEARFTLVVTTPNSQSTALTDNSAGKGFGTDEETSGDEVATPNALPACGGSLLPLAVVPLALGLLRRRLG